MTPTAPTHPLTEADYVQLRNGLDAANRAEQQIELARRAGFNVDKQAAQIAATKDQLIKTLNTYFPGR
jgi:hypothetical protein